MLAALRARAWSGSGRMNVPLTRWPVPNEHGSDTLSSASPAVEMTFAVVEAKYVFARPGVNAPNDAAGPSVSDSVAGTVPPTVPGTLVPYVAGGGTAGRRRVGPRAREVRDRVLQRRRALRPRGDALEAEAPQQRVLGRDARAVGEADGRRSRPTPPRSRCPRAAGRRPTGRGRSRSPLDSRHRAVLEDLQRVEEHAEAADGEVLRVGDRDLDLLALVGAQVDLPVLEAAGVAGGGVPRRRSCRCSCSPSSGVGLVW